MRKKFVDIETWQHFKYPKEKATIKFDRDASEFVAQYGETTLRRATLPDLRERLTKIVSEAIHLEWQPVIQVKVEYKASAIRRIKVGPSSTTTEEESDVNKRSEANGNIELEFCRFWIARAGAQWMSCYIWDSLDDGTDVYQFGKSKIGDPLPRRLNARTFQVSNSVDMAKFSIPFVLTGERGCKAEYNIYYLAYTQKLWDGLNDISLRIEELGKKLESLLKTPEGLKIVEGIFGKLLLPG